MEGVYLGLRFQKGGKTITAGKHSSMGSKKGKRSGKLPAYIFKHKAEGANGN